MHIELIDRFDRLSPHAAHWNNLLTRSASDSVFLTWEWIETWWQVFGSEAELATLLAIEDEQIVGIAPLIIARLPGAAGSYIRTLKFIGQGGDTLAEHLDFIIERGREAPVMRAFVKYICGPLRRQWDALLIERVLTGSPNLNLLTRHLVEHAVIPTKRNAVAAPYLRLPATMQALLAAKSANFRSQYQRGLRKLRAAGNVKWLSAGRDISVDDALATLADLNRARWQQAGLSFRTDRYRQFHTALAHALARRNWLWLSILTVDDEPIAARYDFIYGNKVWCMQGGWKPSHQGLKPGTIMTGEVIAWAIEHGLREYDFLSGDDRYKRRWADSVRTLTDLEAFNPATLRGYLWPGLRKLKKALVPAT